MNIESTGYSNPLQDLKNTMEMVYSSKGYQEERNMEGIPNEHTGTVIPFIPKKSAMEYIYSHCLVFRNINGFSPTHIRMNQVDFEKLLEDEDVTSSIKLFINTVWEAGTDLERVNEVFRRRGLPRIELV